MRNLDKAPIPQVLNDNADKWTQEYLADPENNTKKYRYRDKTIKATLKTETGDKCIYCESKIGHNTPGDTEHIIPSSRAPERRFEWENLTIACRECNRRKNDYYDTALPFLNPYTDDVESLICHLGPIVNWKIGEPRAEATLKKLELNNLNRIELIKRKAELIESLNDKLERLNSSSGVLRELILQQLEDMKDKTSEYSGMVKALVDQTQ